LIQRRKNKWLYRKDYTNLKEGFNGTTSTTTTSSKSGSEVTAANTKRYDQPMAYTQPTDSNKDPAYVAITNTANIAYLKGEVDKLSGLRDKVAELEKRVNENSAAIVDIGSEMSKSAQEATGRDPNSKEPIPQATGL